MARLLQGLRRRKLVQWGLAYAAFAFALLQGVDIVAQRFVWPAMIERLLIVALAVGFFVIVVLAWYHGERGAQRVTGTELLILALLLAIGGGLLWRFGRTPASSPDAVQRNPGKAVPDYAAAAASSGLHTVGAEAVPIPAKSIAVLPFVNMSGDPKQDWFSDGITEEILNALAQAPDLQVAARTSTFAFKGKNEDLRKIGEALGVAHVLEGSVQRVGDEVRITAQLIDTRSGYHLWSEKYDRKFDNVFAVEDEISKAIADKLQAQLGGANSANAGTHDARAHELYLRGLTLLAARGPGLRVAADTFRQAVAIDPKYAQAWAGLAQAEMQVHIWHYDSDGTAMTAADDAARRALQIDPNVAAAHVALGILHDGRGQWADADREFRRALELAPNDAEALDQYAQFLWDVGSLSAALPVIERANRLDPYSGIIGAVHAGVLLDLHRYDAAQAQLNRTLGVAPDSVRARAEALRLALLRKDYTAAEAQAPRVAALAGYDPETFDTFLRGVADPAQRGTALQLVGKLSAEKKSPFASWRILLGDREGAMRDLEAKYGGARVGPTFRLWNPQLDPLRDDPRFKMLLKKQGLPYTPQDAPAK